MNEVKENIFRYPNDIVSSHNKLYVKRILLMFTISVIVGCFLSSLFAYSRGYLLGPFCWEMLLVITIAPIIFWLILGAILYLMNILLLASSLKNTEIILCENNLTRRVKDKEDVINWGDIQSVKIYIDKSGVKTINIVSRDRKTISILSDIERIDELIALIKRKLSSSIITERKYSLLDYALGGIIGLIYSGLWCYAILYDISGLESILIISLFGFFVFILLKFGMFSSTYGSKGKWIDRILIVWFIYELIRSTAKFTLSL